MLYFAYGSNMLAARMAGRAPAARRIGTATLRGWRLAERLYADIERRRGGTVRGVVWELDDSGLAALDRFEGYPDTYGGDDLAVAIDGMPGTVLAWTYFMTPAARARRRGSPFPAWYAAVCAAGARENGIPDAWWRKRIYRRDFAH